MMQKEEEEVVTVCVVDASTYVGFWLVKKLLIKGYKVHAAVRNNGEEELVKKLRGLERTESGMITIFTVDMLDYHSILEALRCCSGLFCCLDSPDKYDDEKMVDSEVRGAINVVEACAQTESIRKIVFSSSLTAAVWRQTVDSQKDIVDERTWTDQDFCRKMKTQSEKAAWALAMDRMVDMVSINAGLVIGPNVAKHNPQLTLSYLQGAEQMYVNGVLASVDVDFLSDVHIRAFQDSSTTGRYLCFDQIISSDAQAVKLANILTPLISIPSRYDDCEEISEIHGGERLRKGKLSKLIEGTAY